jgi:hypothetical protein
LSGPALLSVRFKLTEQMVHACDSIPDGLQHIALKIGVIDVPPSI